VRKASAQATSAKVLSATAEQILDIAQMLMQTRSYSAFSYQDIADTLGIRKASIHYHFATKADLGVAVVDRYVEHFGSALAAMAEDSSRSSLALLDFYCEPYLQFARTDDRVCLCGALAAETLALPIEMRERVARFFRYHQAWLERILARGAQCGEFKLSAPAARTARMIFGAMQGALIVKRTTGDMTQLKDVILALKAQLAPDRSAKAAPAVRPRRLRQ
jgi:TetR/AcrR family transcriptional repressor of nem operon